MADASLSRSDVTSTQLSQRGSIQSVSKITNLEFGKAPWQRAVAKCRVAKFTISRAGNFHTLEILEAICACVPLILVARCPRQVQDCEVDDLAGW